MTDTAATSTKVIDFHAFLARRRATAAAEVAGPSEGADVAVPPVCPALSPSPRARALSALEVDHRRRMLRHLGALERPGAR